MIAASAGSAEASRVRTVDAVGQAEVKATRQTRIVVRVLENMVMFPAWQKWFEALCWVDLIELRKRSVSDERKN